MTFFTERFYRDEGTYFACAPRDRGDPYSKWKFDRTKGVFVEIEIQRARILKFKKRPPKPGEEEK